MEPIAVLGAGVTGLTTAIVLAERGYRTEVLARDSAEGSASGAAAAIWYPYDAGAQIEVTAWALITCGRLFEIANDTRSGVTLVELRSCTRATTIDVPLWAHSLQFRLLKKDELLDEFRAGYAVTVPLMDATRYLPWLRHRLTMHGVPIRHAELEELPQCNVVVNCTGYGARALLHDEAVEPHRGQSVVAAPLDTPDLKHALVSLDEPLTYIIPRESDCILGGVNEVSESMTVDDSATSRIVAECTRILGARLRSPIAVREARVGLRPFRRSGVRVACERLPDGRLVVHNYGHGGAGFTLSWGCAEAAAALVRLSWH